MLAGSAAALLLAAAASARDLDTRERGILPSGTTGLVVVDLSLSIADEDYNEVRRVLNGLIEQEARIGLVVFSDVPYELLPPGTPASELRPMLRLLVPPNLGTPINPWTGTFRAGTRISTALELAQAILLRDRVENASILLVSDLETAPEDVPTLVQTVETIRRSDISFRVVGLAPSSDARAIFEGLLQRGEFRLPTDTVAGDPEASANETTSALPTTLLILGACFFLALAVHERYAGRLALPAGGRRRPA